MVFIQQILWYFSSLLSKSLKVNTVTFQHLIKHSSALICRKEHRYSTKCETRQLGTPSLKEQATNIQVKYKKQHCKAGNYQLFKSTSMSRQGEIVVE